MNKEKFIRELKALRRDYSIKSDRYDQTVLDIASMLLNILDKEQGVFDYELAEMIADYGGGWEYQEITRTDE